MSVYYTVYTLTQSDVQLDQTCVIQMFVQTIAFMMINQLCRRMLFEYKITPIQLLYNKSNFTARNRAYLHTLLYAVYNN